MFSPFMLILHDMQTKLSAIERDVLCDREVSQEAFLALANCQAYVASLHDLISAEFALNSMDMPSDDEIPF